MKSISYYALVNREKSPGVANKIDNTVLAAEKIGFNSTCNLYNIKLMGVFSLIIAMLRERSDIVIIRFSSLVFPIIFFLMIYLRLKGTKIIVDVPTPRKIGLRELDTAIRNPLYRAIRKVISVCSASWVLFPAHLIIQYADESKWFSFGVKNKSIKVGNGIIMPDSTQAMKTKLPTETLNLIGVAQLAHWHGFDRVVGAMYELSMRKLDFEINFTIIGDGDELSGLKKLVKKYDLQNIVFTGMLTGDELNQFFNDAHIGIASLGLYRKGLTEASDLKTREYMARGLSVIAAGGDPDFNDDCPFRYQIPNNGSITELTNLIASFHNKELPHSDKIRAYAKANLTLEHKLKTILDILNVKVNDDIL